ncbi:hypothetical protein [Stenotrophomonas sp. S41]|uniref:hypothetical protein n=1 Tax=Stenotrophomonas sp. S41 TaxID=2767464 RepID=UPI00190C69D2|nr:hypothetical protein [Stenotrophomonas sp. S41]MBK0013378.1 hypothetical protein [Stenotrophomonas sp. S41]
MPDGNAKIIVGASPVAAGRRHTYLLFEHSDGSQQVVRGGPDTQPEGNALSNLAGSTLLGSDNYGHIQVDAAPYEPPQQFVSQRQADGSHARVPLDQARLDDPALQRNAEGKVMVGEQRSPDWPLPGETHERQVVWQGSDQELEKKLAAAKAAGQQINDAQMEYSPLYNNSNGVTSTLMKAADITPSLPKDKDGKTVDAPDFGENLHQDVGLGSHRSGYWFDGKQWYDGDDRRIQPPRDGEKTVPLDPDAKSHSGSGPLRISANDGEAPRQGGNAGFSTGDAELDRMASALYAGDDAAFNRAAANIAQSPEVAALAQQDQAAHEQAQVQAQNADAAQRQQPAQQPHARSMDA